MKQKKNFLSLFFIMIISSFLIGGCYTQLERPGVRIDDEEDAYYYETTDSEYADEEYEAYDTAASRDVQYNYYFYDSPYHYSYYPYNYRPFNRFDALLYFNYYDSWLNYYTWWPVAGYSWWPAHSMYSYFHYDPWGYRYQHYSPHWWDRHYYGGGRGYVAAHVPQKQRPFIGQRPSTRMHPSEVKERTDIQPVSQKRFVRQDGSTIQKTSKRTAGTNYSRPKVRNDETTRRTPPKVVQPTKTKRSEDATQQRVSKTRNTTKERDKSQSNVRPSSRSSSRQRETSARPSRSTSSAPKRSAVQPTRRSSPPPQRSTSSGSSSKSSDSGSRGSSSSSKKKSK